MTLHRRTILVGVALLALVASALPLRGDVRGDTGLFSPAAIQQAEQIMRQIRQQSGRDMIVEVFNTLPSNLRSNYRPENKDAFFREMTRSRVQELRANGVYVLVSRNPSYVETWVGGETEKRAFTSQNRAELARLLLDNFKQQRFDAGLVEGARFVQQTMARNLAAGSGAGAGAGRTSQAPAVPGRGVGGGAFPKFSCFWVLVIGAGILVLISFLRRRSQRQQYGYGGYGPGRPGNYPPGNYPPDYNQQGGYPPPGYGGQGGAGGGFGRGILGGLLGGAAGGYLYDKLSGGRGQGGGQAYGAPPPPQDPGNAPDQGMGGGMSGGSFEPDNPPLESGGGDFGGGFSGGGGDAGGGDFGGGDFGGGGDSA